MRAGGDHAEIRSSFVCVPQERALRDSRMQQQGQVFHRMRNRLSNTVIEDPRKMCGVGICSCKVREEQAGHSAKQCSASNTMSEENVDRIRVRHILVVLIIQFESFGNLCALKRAENRRSNNEIIWNLIKGGPQCLLCLWVHNRWSSFVN